MDDKKIKTLLYKLVYYLEGKRSEGEDGHWLSSSSEDDFSAEEVNKLESIIDRYYARVKETLSKG